MEHRLEVEEVVPFCDGSYAAGAAEVKGVIDGKGIMSVQRSAFQRKCTFIYVSKIVGASLIASEA
jgi:hypothetical protein